jgi:hypothetical protein
MPGQARLDAPGVLHHVMVRGIERTTLFRDDTDRTDFVARVATLAEAWTVYAWALLPNMRISWSGRGTGRSPGVCAPSSRVMAGPSIAAGLPQGRRPELQAGGLLRSLGGRPSRPSAGGARRIAGMSESSAGRSSWRS